MPRSNRPRRSRSKREEAAELNIEAARNGIRTTTVKRGVVYVVQSHGGAAQEADKSWICPECHLTISQGTPHTVAYDEQRGPTNRRHFHTHCWRIFQGPLL